MGRLESLIRSDFYQLIHAGRVSGRVVRRPSTLHGGADWEKRLTTVFEIADKLTEDYADLEPILATTSGVAGRDDRWDDFSPAGEAAKADLRASASRELTPHLDDPDPVQANAAKIMLGYLKTMNALFDAGFWKNDLNHIYSPFQQARDTFDVAPQDGPEAWSAITRRLETFGEMLDSYRSSLQVGLDEGTTAARRQVESVIDQVRSVAGSESRFLDLVALAADNGGDEAQVAAAAEIARAAAAGFADWLEHSYLPAADPNDGVGRDRYQSGAQYFLGMDLDTEDTYEWGWDELHRLRQSMTDTAREIDSGKSVEEVIEFLDTDPSRSSEDHADFARFVKEIQDRAVSQLDGVAFDVPPAIREVSVNIAPPGGSLGAWYHAPSEDFSRNGSIWYAPGSRTRIPYWQEVSTAYHEGFPGHHLQVGIAVLEREKLSRFHRQFVWYSGAGEGWALYAERLMDELGFFENPEYRLGLLASQLFRSTRVVVDIGTHLGKEIPSDAPLHAGETWSYEIAVDYVEKVGLNPRDVAESEVKRYLGWPAQAISYKVGEREILDMRSVAEKKAGGDLDRKDFHRRLLEAGAIRLDHLREAMA
jgi:uncharacterized protein (DUF885 family)